MKASKFSEAQKAFILKQGADGMSLAPTVMNAALLWLLLTAFTAAPEAWRIDRAASTIDLSVDDVTLTQALTRVGGLVEERADARGVFVFRNEPAEIANAVLGRKDLQGDQRMIYVLDLTQPTGMFEARDFLVRDGDTVYVTEAPFVQWQKTLTAITGTSGARAASCTRCRRCSILGGLVRVRALSPRGVNARSKHNVGYGRIPPP